MPSEWYFARTGLTPAALYREFEEQNGVTIDTAEVSRRYGPIFLSNLDKAEEITVVAEVARANFGKVPMAVASNGHLDNVKATLRATRLLDLFETRGLSRPGGAWEASAGCVSGGGAED